MMRYTVVTEELLADQFTPIGIFQALAKDKKEAVLLDSSADLGLENCTYIGLDPLAEFSAFGNLITEIINHKKETYVDNPFNALRNFYLKIQCTSENPTAKFAGGIIGFLAYDAVREIESIPNQHKNIENIPDFHFKAYSTQIIFDKSLKKITLAKVIRVTEDNQSEVGEAKKAIDEIIKKIHSNDGLVSSNKDQAENSIEMDIEDIDYIQMVEKAKEAIKQGEIFQMVLSRQFRQKFTGNDFDIYRALCLLNPSSYQFYLRQSEFTLVGSSPERLVSLKNQIIETMPIAGTRLRGLTTEEDLIFEKELKSDKKELAEHRMLVDLSRNDIGSIAMPGSVKVENLAETRRYHNVMHMVSQVQGKLRSNLDAFDVLKATFPAGTLSGAPKIRAMELIDDIETSRRGIYGGAICAIDNRGEMDSCITIRTALIKEGVATVRAGAGIVMDSDPQKEADETKHKAKTILKALSLAQGGLI